MKLNELNFVLDEAKLLGKQNFVFHNKTKRLFVVVSTHVRRGRHNRHVKLVGWPDIREFYDEVTSSPHAQALVKEVDKSRMIGEFVIPLEVFKHNFTKVEDPDMFRILYEKS